MQLVQSFHVMLSAECKERMSVSLTKGSEKTEPIGHNTDFYDMLLCALRSMMGKIPADLFIYLIAAVEEQEGVDLYGMRNCDRESWVAIVDLCVQLDMVRRQRATG